MKILRKISHYDAMNNKPCITEIHDVPLEESILNIEWNPCLVSNYIPKTVFKYLEIKGFTFSNTSTNYIVPDSNISNSVLGTCITLKHKDITILDSSKFISWSKFIWDFQDLLPEAGYTVKYILEKKDIQQYDMLLLISHNLKKTIKDCILDNLNYKEGQEWHKLISEEQSKFLNKFYSYGNPNAYSGLLNNCGTSVGSRFFKRIVTNEFIRSCIKEIELNIGVNPLHFKRVIDVDYFVQGQVVIPKVADKVYYKVTDFREYVLPEDFSKRILNCDYHFIKDFVSAPLKIVNPEYLVMPSGIETKDNELLGFYITLLQGKTVPTLRIKRPLSDIEYSILERILEVDAMHRFEYSSLLPINKSINFKIIK
jgi:hypothetical protein